LPDAGPEQPRLNIPANPYPAPRVLGIALRPIVLALGILGPIERESVAHQPIGKVNAVDRTHGDCAPVLIKANRNAIDRSFS
jgi:hypothetical protein